MKTAKAFAPAAISSFFEIHNHQNHEPILMPEKVGARGGGFGLKKGVFTKISLKKAAKNSVNIFINKQLVPQAKTTSAVVQMLLAKTSEKFEVSVWHDIEVPIGMGFGTSAGGALTAGLALSSALELPLTYNQIGRLAHIAEIQSQTGLGTVSSLTFAGGCILVVQPGAPGICQIDRIPLPDDYAIVAGFCQPSSIDKSALSNPEKHMVINRCGKETLKAILAKPTVENFLDCCWRFAQDSGFATPKVRQLVALAKEAGAVGATQNMLGEAVHAVVKRENAQKVAEALKQVLPSPNVIVSEIDFQGVRLIE